MPIGRSEREELGDILLMMYTIRLSEGKKCIFGRTDFMKHIFLSQVKMHTNSTRGFTFTFKRHNNGPYAKDAHDLMYFLEEAGICTGIEDEEHIVRLTDRGRTILREMEGQLKENRTITSYIRQIMIKYCFVKTQDLLDIVYAMMWPYRGGMVPISDIPKGTVLMNKLPDSSAETTLAMDDDWWATFESFVDVEYADKIERAHIGAREGRLRKFELTTI